jgi:predicted DNA-binding transcriptional regulator AlpA
VVYFTPDQVADRYQVSEATLKEWRYKGTGPEYVRLGRHVRYPARALEEWEAKREAAARAR